MLVADVSSLPDGLTGALRTASARSGAPFEYLLKTAMRESGLNPNATAHTSSATGLFQFVEQTWLELVKEEGTRFGLAAESAMIDRTARGAYRVADPEARRAILALRKDPGIASAMAGEFARRNAAHLTKELGRPPTQGELYIAHFLGAGGAVRLIRHAARAPDASATELFPAQAAANRPIFYAAGGRSRSVADVYANLVGQHGVDPLRMTAGRADAPGPVLAYASSPPTETPLGDWPRSAAIAVRSRFAALEPREDDGAGESPRPPAPADIPLSRFALAAIEAQESGEAERVGRTVSRLRPAPQSGWSDEGPIESAQLLPIAGRFSPR